MTTATTTARRRWSRPDRAQRHGELADLAQLSGVYTLRAWVVDCGGEESWDDLLERIDGARRGLGVSVSMHACLCGLGVLAAMHRRGEIGFRGLIGASALIAERVSEICGTPRGLGERTLRSVWRVLEAADLLERWTHGRGKQREYGSTSNNERTHNEMGCCSVLQGPGRERKTARRPVLALTLSVVAVSYWSAPRRKGGRSGGDVGKKPTPANVADTTIPEKGDSPNPRYARATCGSTSSSCERLEAVSPFGDDVGHGAKAPGTGTARERGARPVPPRRLVPWRPDPHDPNDHGTAATALLYDLETVLLHHRRDDRPRILGLARAELDPRRKLIELMGGDTPKGSGLPWDTWVWRWRGLPLEDRRIACERSLLPALVGHLRRIELCELNPDPLARPRTAEPKEIGPRIVPEKNAAPVDVCVLGGVAPRRRPPAVRYASTASDVDPGFAALLERLRGKFCGDDNRGRGSGEEI